MKSRPLNQGEINFAAESGESGYSAWQAQRRAMLHALAHELGLPVGHRVEVWLKGNVRLRGKLQLREEKLFLDNARHTAELEVDGIPFRLSEIESCVRLDATAPGEIPDSTP